MATIVCGNCKNTHASVQEVKDCYNSIASKDSAPLADWRKDREARLHAQQLAVTPVARLRQAAEKLPNVPVARYALLEDVLDYAGISGAPAGCVVGQRWNFYQVDRPVEGKWAGYVFIKLMHSEETGKINFQRQLSVIEAIAAKGASVAAADYGHQIGRCSICDRTLTDPESINAGIGPICAGKLA